MSPVSPPRSSKTLNIISLVHRLDSRTPVRSPVYAYVDISWLKLKTHPNVYADVVGRSQGSFSKLSPTRFLTGSIFKRACESGLRDPLFTTRGE